MTKKLKIFIKRFNGSAVFSEPSVKLTNKKINRICNTLKLNKSQSVEKLLK